MYNSFYKNKFSFGIDLNISINDYKKIIEKYKDYLSSVYFSLPFGERFHTRRLMIEEYKQKNAIEKLKEILMLFRNNNIKLEAVINQYNIKEDELKEALYKLDNYIKVDTICCLDEYIDIINEHYNNDMYLISSFNNRTIHEDSIYNINNKYDMIVLGREFLREPDLIKKVKRRGFDIKLLINNGCSFNCRTCRYGGEECVQVFKSNLKKFNIEELYAMQSFFPWELYRLMESFKDENIINEIKISSRPSTFEYLNDCLKSYIFDEDEKIYIVKNEKKYHLYGRQANLIPYYNYLNIDNVERIKKSLWE